MSSAGYVYEIKNKVNGNCYIGSTINPKARWAEHKGRLRNNKHHSFIMQNAWKKYGEGAFEFNVILQCDRTDMIDYENRLMVMQSYNVKRTAREHLFVYTESFREKCRQGRVGSITSDETKAKLRELQLKAKAERVEANNKLALQIYAEYDGSETLSAMYKRLGTNQRTMYDAFVRLGLNAPSRKLRKATQA